MGSEITYRMTVKGTRLQFIDASGSQRYILGTFLQTIADDEARKRINIKGTCFHYVDMSGDERYFEGVLV